MKKAEVGNQQLTLEARVAAIEATQAAILARLEKLDPKPPIAVREPYSVGSTVYSVADLEARYPIVVRGYRNGRILVETSPGEPEREWPLESVIPLAKCRNATPTPEKLDEQIDGHLDPKTREYYLGRRKAQLEAATKPSGPFIPTQRRYVDGH